MIGFCSHQKRLNKNEKFLGLRPPEVRQPGQCAEEKLQKDEMGELQTGTVTDGCLKFLNGDNQYSLE